VRVRGHVCLGEHPPTTHENPLLNTEHIYTVRPYVRMYTDHPSTAQHSTPTAAMPGRAVILLTVLHTIA
jgi:hypothetical protein